MPRTNSVLDTLRELDRPLSLPRYSNNLAHQSPVHDSTYGLPARVLIEDLAGVSELAHLLVAERRRPTSIEEQERPKAMQRKLEGSARGGARAGSVEPTERGTAAATFVTAWTRFWVWQHRALVRHAADYRGRNPLTGRWTHQWVSHPLMGFTAHAGGPRPLQPFRRSLTGTITMPRRSI